MKSRGSSILLYKGRVVWYPGIAFGRQRPAPGSATTYRQLRSPLSGALVMTGGAASIPSAGVNADGDPVDPAQCLVWNNEEQLTSDLASTSHLSGVVNVLELCVTLLTEPADLAVAALTALARLCQGFPDRALRSMRLRACESITELLHRNACPSLLSNDASNSDAMTGISATSGSSVTLAALHCICVLCEFGGDEVRSKFADAGVCEFIVLSLRAYRLLSANGCIISKNNSINGISNNGVSLTRVGVTTTWLPIIKLGIDALVQLAPTGSSSRVALRLLGGDIELHCLQYGVSGSRHNLIAGTGSSSSGSSGSIGSSGKGGVPTSSSIISRMYMPSIIRDNLDMADSVDKLLAILNNELPSDTTLYCTARLTSPDPHSSARAPDITVGSADMWLVAGTLRAALAMQKHYQTCGGEESALEDRSVALVEAASRTLVLLVNDGRYDGILRSRRVDRFIMHGGCELLLKVLRQLGYLERCVQAACRAIVAIVTTSSSGHVAPPSMAMLPSLASKTSSQTALSTALTNSSVAVTKSNKNSPVIGSGQMGLTIDTGRSLRVGSSGGGGSSENLAAYSTYSARTTTSPMTATTTTTTTTTEEDFDDNCDDCGRVADLMHDDFDHRAVVEVEDLSDLAMLPFAEQEPTSVLEVFHRSDTLVGYSCGLAKLVPDIDIASSSSSSSTFAGTGVRLNNILARVERVPTIAVEISTAPKLPEAMQMDGQESSEELGHSVEGHLGAEWLHGENSHILLVDDSIVIDNDAIGTGGLPPYGYISTEDNGLGGANGTSTIGYSSNSSNVPMCPDASMSCGWVHPSDDALLTPLSTELMSAYESMRFKQELFLRADISRTLVELLRVLYRDNLIDSSVADSNSSSYTNNNSSGGGMFSSLSKFFSGGGGGTGDASTGRQGGYSDLAASYGSYATPSASSSASSSSYYGSNASGGPSPRAFVRRGANYPSSSGSSSYANSSINTYVSNASSNNSTFTFRAAPNETLVAIGEAIKALVRGNIRARIEFSGAKLYRLLALLRKEESKLAMPDALYVEALQVWLNRELIEEMFGGTRAGESISSAYSSSDASSVNNVGVSNSSYSSYSSSRRRSGGCVVVSDALDAAVCIAHAIEIATPASLRPFDTPNTGTSSSATGTSSSSSPTSSHTSSVGVVGGIMSRPGGSPDFGFPPQQQQQSITSSSSSCSFHGTCPWRGDCFAFIDDNAPGTVHEATMLVRALEAMALLATRDDNADAIRVFGVRCRGFAAMKRLGEASQNLDVLSQWCSTVATIASKLDMKRLLGAEGMCEVIANLLVVHYSRPWLVQALLWCLCAVAGSDVDNMGRLLRWRAARDKRSVVDMLQAIYRSKSQTNESRDHAELLLGWLDIASTTLFIPSSPPAPRGSGGDGSNTHQCDLVAPIDLSDPIEQERLIVRYVTESLALAASKAISRNNRTPRSHSDAAHFEVSCCQVTPGGARIVIDTDCSGAVFTDSLVHGMASLTSLEAYHGSVYV